MTRSSLCAGMTTLASADIAPPRLPTRRTAPRRPAGLWLNSRCDASYPDPPVILLFDDGTPPHSPTASDRRMAARRGP